MQELNESIALRIKERRKELGLTQKSISDVTGLSTGNISDMENGKYLPSASAIILLSRALNCSTDWILTGETQISDNLNLLHKYSKLLRLFNQLTSEDKNEIEELIEFKLFRYSNSSKIGE